MNKVFWYGSLVAPLVCTVLVAVLLTVFAMLVGTGVLPQDDPSRVVPLAVISGGVVMLPALAWFVVANVAALYRVMTDPDNSQKPLWLLGWLFFNMFMHVAFVVLYVAREPSTVQGADPTDP